MGIYENETSRIYSGLGPTTPQEPQSYRLNKLSEIEAYFLNEIEVHEQIAKKMKRSNTITGIVDTDLVTSTMITGGISIAAFASGAGLPVGIALSGTSYFFLLRLFASHENLLKSFKILTVKWEKHDAI